MFSSSRVAKISKHGVPQAVVTGTIGLELGDTDGVREGIAEGVPLGLELGDLEGDAEGKEGPLTHVASGLA